MKLQPGREDHKTNTTRLQHGWKILSHNPEYRLQGTLFLSSHAQHKTAKTGNHSTNLILTTLTHTHPCRLWFFFLTFCDRIIVFDISHLVLCRMLWSKVDRGKHLCLSRRNNRSLWGGEQRENFSSQMERIPRPRLLRKRSLPDTRWLHRK